MSRDDCAAACSVHGTRWSGFCEECVALSKPVDHFERLKEYAAWGGKDSTYQWALDEIERLRSVA